MGIVKKKKNKKILRKKNKFIVSGIAFNNIVNAVKINGEEH